MKKLLLAMLMLSGCGSPFVEDTTILKVINVAPPKASQVKATKFKKVKNIHLDKNQVLYISGQIGDQMQDFIEQLHAIEATEVSEIYILIDSPGGSVQDGAKFISAMEASSKPVYTVCMGICASMAAMIHQYGKKRYMVDRTVLMFHDASGGLQGSVPQMQSRLTYITRLTMKMDAFVANRAGVKVEDFMQALQAEIWLDAEDATDRSFNDGIVNVSGEGAKAPRAFILNLTGKSTKREGLIGTFE